MGMPVETGPQWCVEGAWDALVRRLLRMQETPSFVRMVLPDHFDRRSLVFVCAAGSLADRYASAYDDK